MQEKFKVDINKYRIDNIIPKHTIYDFRDPKPETEEDLKHHIDLCRELGYFERKKLEELKFKFSEEYFFEGEGRHVGRGEIFLRKLELLKRFYDAKITHTIPKKYISLESYKDAHGFISFSNVERKILKDGNRYIYANEISVRIEILKKLLDFKKRLSCKDILEYGCGDGTNLILLSRLYGPHRISGFEYPAARFASSLVNFEIHNVRLENFFMADGRNLPLKDESFDLVFSLGVLEQLKDDLERSLNELLRVAKKGILLYEPSNFRATFCERRHVEMNHYPEDILGLLNNRDDIEVIECSKPHRRGWINPLRFFLIKKIGR